MVMNLHPRVIVLLALLLSTGCLYSEFAPGESTTATLDSFRENGPFFESDLMTQPGLDQSILPAYLRDRNVADIIVATVAEDNVKTLQLFEMHQGYYRANASVVRQLDEKVIFLDVAATVGREMLVVFYAGYAVELDPVDGATKPLIEFSSIYNGPVDQQLPKLDLARDLNGDGLDDFIIPGFQGYEVYIQQIDGSFGDQIALSAPAIMDISYRQNPWYQVRKIYHTDVTNDGRADLSLWVDDEFLVYRQLLNGSFSDVPISFSPPILFDAEGYEGVSMRMGGEDQSDAQKKALFQLKDFTGDGIPEIVTLSVKSQGVLKKSTTYEIHKGVKPISELGLPWVPSFLAEPGSKIRSRGIQFDLEEKDLNNDGQLDIIVSSVEIGLGKIVRALITGSIAINLDFYQMADGEYPERPNLEREVTATFNMSSGDLFLPTVLISDITGDGQEDLVVQNGGDTLEIYEGVGSGLLFARKATKMTVEMPRDPDLVESIDLNADGKQDLVIRLEPKEGSKIAHRLKILVAK
jgi:hypothetical protein